MAYDEPGVSGPDVRLSDAMNPLAQKHARVRLAQLRRQGFNPAQFGIQGDVTAQWRALSPILGALRNRQAGQLGQYQVPAGINPAVAQRIAEMKAMEAARRAGLGAPPMDVVAQPMSAGFSPGPQEWPGPQESPGAPVWPGPQESPGAPVWPGPQEESPGAPVWPGPQESPADLPFPGPQSPADIPGAPGVFPGPAAQPPSPADALRQRLTGPRLAPHVQLARRLAGSSNRDLLRHVARARKVSNMMRHLKKVRGRRPNLRGLPE